MAAEAVLRSLADLAALMIQGFAVVVIAYGALETLVFVAGESAGVIPRPQNWRRNLFVGFGRWLIWVWRSLWPRTSSAL